MFRCYIYDSIFLEELSLVFPEFTEVILSPIATLYHSCH